MKHIIYFLLIIFSLYIKLNAQGTIDTDIGVPPQNNFGNQNFNNSIDLSTGAISPNLPLATLGSTIGHSVGVNLVYTSGQGIRVNDIASRVGLGWELSTGGKITRQVRGIPDETENGGWLSLNYYTSWWVNGDSHGFNAPVSGQNTIASTYLSQIIIETFTTIGYYPGHDLPTVQAARAVFLRRLMERHPEDYPLDGEPDIFHFNVGSYSGKFLFNEQREIILLPHQDIKIEAVNPFSASGTAWIITTPDGIKYVFNNNHNESTKEYIITHDKDQKWKDNIFRQYTSDWNLSKIEVKGTEAFLYTYQTIKPYSVYYLNENQISYVGTQNDGQNCTETMGMSDLGEYPKILDTSTLQVKLNPKEIASIESDLGEIIFENETNPAYLRKDRWYNSQLNWYSFPLKSIKTKTLEGVIIKQFNFITDYFFSNNINPYYNEPFIEFTPTSFPPWPPAHLEDYLKHQYFVANFNNRLKLHEIHELSTNGNPILTNKYQFEYNPAPTTSNFYEWNNQDQWGFYKHNSFNGTLNYTGSFYNGWTFDGKTLPHLINIPDYVSPYTLPLTNAQPSYWGYIGFDKSAINSLPGSLVLNKIKYPTGAITEYEYEQNDYYDPINNINKLTGGIRVKKVRQIDSHVSDVNSNCIETNYTYNQESDVTKSSGTIADPRQNYNYQRYYCSADVFAIYFQRSTNGHREPSAELVRYSCVTVSQPGAGKTVNSFTSFEEYQDEQIERYFMPVHGRANYCEYMHTNSNSSFYTTIYPRLGDYDDDPGAPLVDMSYKRGLLKFQKFYQEIPVGANPEDYKVKQINYQYTFSPGGYINKEIKAYKVSSSYHPRWGDQCEEVLPEYNIDIFKYVSGTVALVSTEEKVYELVSGVVDKNKSFTTITNLAYAHSPLRLKSKTVQTLDCSADYYEQYTYAADLGIDVNTLYADADLEGIRHLLLNNQGGTPIEINYGNIQNDPAKTDNIVHGSLTTFRKHTGTIYDFALSHQSFNLEINYPYDLSGFQTCYNNSGVFEYNSSYKLKSTMNYDLDKYITSVKSEPDQYSSIKYGYNKKFVIAKFDKCDFSEEECDYNGFEHFGAPQSWLFIGWGLTGNTYISQDYSHTGSYSYKLEKSSSSGNFSIGPNRFISPKNQDRNYLLSAWIKTPANFVNQAGRMEVKIYKDDGVTPVLNNNLPDFIEYFSYNSLWKYYALTIDLAQFRIDNSNSIAVGERLKLNIEFKNFDTSSDFYIDDIIFRPYYSTAETYTYNNRYQVSSSASEMGNPVFTKYDQFDRVKEIRNKDKNLIEVREYQIRDWQTGGANYKNSTSVYNYKEPFQTHSGSGYYPLTGKSDYIKRIVYTDDLGRPIQKIAVNQSPDGRDIIQHLEYEPFNGREIRKYLPFARVNLDNEGQGGSYRPDAQSETIDFYHNNEQDIPHSDFPYAESLLDNSPLGTLIKQGAPGKEWQLTGHPKRFDYTTETISIMNWTVDREPPMVVSGTDCPAQLSVTIAYDEDNNKIINYSNNLGRVVLSRKIIPSTTEPTTGLNFSTFDFTDGTANDVHTYDPDFAYDSYNIYDDFGRVIFEIPPSAVQHFNSTGSYEFSVDPPDDVFNEYIIAYEYDQKGRLFAKKTPGIDWMYYVYDNLDRLVLSQNPKQRGANVLRPEWSFTKFDELGRVIQTGIIKTALNRYQLQSQAFGADYLYEDKLKTTTPSSYTNKAFPILDIDYDEVWVTNFYDHYENGWPAYNGNYLPSWKQPITETFNLLTGTLVKTLNVSPAQELLSVYYYDDRYNVLQEISENHLNGKDIYTNDYDDMKLKLLTGWREHYTDYNLTPLVIKTRYEYDHAGRVVREHQKLNSDPEFVLVGLNYNALGKLSRKSLHGTELPSGDPNLPPSYAYLQNIEYKTNIRGWIKSINNSNLLPDGFNGDMNDVFGEDLIYTQDDIDAANFTNVNNPIIPRYNGNIAAMAWKTKATTADASLLPRHLYTYRYDAANRMTAAYYSLSEIIPNNKFTVDHNFYDEILSYDLAGNPITLKRNALANLIDDLIYDYHTVPAAGGSLNSYRLKAIEDQVSATGYGFNNHASLTEEYFYDENGSTIENKNKNTVTAYTYFDLPESIVIDNNTIEYFYDVTGRKLAEVSSLGTHHYIDGIEYVGVSLRSVMTSEGKFRRSSIHTQNGWQYIIDYFIKDHLHNVRAVITNEVARRTYLATLEEQYSEDERQMFLNTDETREDKDAAAPPDPEYNPDDKVSETNAADGRNIGVAKVMNLMQGDVIDFDTRYYYEEYTPVQTQAPVYSILSQLANIFIFNATSIAGVPFGSEDEQLYWANQTFLQNGEVTNFLIEQFEDTNRVIEAPHAYLTWLYFTERFEFVPEASGMLLAENPDVLGEMGVEGLEMPLDGFLYIYVNNESAHDVQFDNLRIRYNPGQLLQVNHYYPYGLPIKELSTQPTLGKPYNDYLMTTKEWNTEFGLNEYDFGARSYDPAIARWYVQDPAEQFYNPYLAIGNNPVVLYDPDGRFIPILIGAALGAYIGASSANGSYNPGQWDMSSGKTWAGMFLGAGLGALGGHGFAVGAPELAGTGFFANFGASGTVAAYTLTGAATGAGIGYSSGFTGAVMGGANLEQAHNGGWAGAQIGAGVGSVGGAIAGIVNGYVPEINNYFNSGPPGDLMAYAGNSQLYSSNYVTGEWHKEPYATISSVKEGDGRFKLRWNPSGKIGLGFAERDYYVTGSVYSEILAKKYVNGFLVDQRIISNQLVHNC
jgi:RHS repeat-associated protein